MNYEDMLSYENFFLAFRRLQTVQRDYYKNIYWEDLYNFSLDIEKKIM